MSEFNAGDRVITCVFVCGKRVDMGRGIVTKVHDGYCDVDHCPMGAPWIYGEMNQHIRLDDSQP